MSQIIECAGNECPISWMNPHGRGIDQNSSMIEKKIISTMLELILNTFWNHKNDMLKTLNNLFLKCSIENWDGEKALPISFETYQEARKLIISLPSRVPIPDIFAEPNGDIAFEWYREIKHIFVISVEGQNKIAYSGIFGENVIHGTIDFDQSLPHILIQNIRKIYE